MTRGRCDAVQRRRERNWQHDDLQWFRAKAADTFGPLGPALSATSTTAS